MITDEALIYANFRNLLTDKESLDYFDKKLQPRGFLPLGSKQETLQKLDDILSLTNIKRACCLGSQDPDDQNSLIIKQQLPPPPGHVFDTTTSRGKIYKKYGFIEKNVKIPKSLCASLGSNYENPKGISCQNFYTVYCKNSMELFNQLNGGVFNHDDWIYYRPECACFAPIPESIKKTGINIPPTCYLAGCESVKGVFLDPFSASPDTNCNLTICTADIDMSDFTAGRDISVQNKIEQNCGPGNVDNSQPKEDSLTSGLGNILSNVGNISSNLRSSISSLFGGDNNRTLIFTFGGLGVFIFFIIILVVLIISFI